MDVEIIKEVIKGLLFGLVMGISNAHVSLILAKDMVKYIIKDVEKINRK